MSRYLLSILLFLPLLGALVIMFTPRQYLRTLRGFSVGVMLIEFAISLRLLFDRHFDAVDWSDASYKFVEAHSWVESLGIQYKVGVDGISLWLVVLTTALTPIALFGSWQSIDTKIKEFAIAFLLLECGMIGAFVSLDLFLFYVFWELMLVPMYLIIGIWGGKDRVYAAVKFFIFTMVGSLLMLVALLFLVSEYERLSGHYSFDLVELGRLRRQHRGRFIQNE